MLYLISYECCSSHLIIYNNNIYIIIFLILFFYSQCEHSKLVLYFQNTKKNISNIINCFFLATWLVCNRFKCSELSCTQAYTYVCIYHQYFQHKNANHVRDKQATNSNFSTLLSTVFSKQIFIAIFLTTTKNAAIYIRTIYIYIFPWFSDVISIFILHTYVCMYLYASAPANFPTCFGNISIQFAFAHSPI